MKKVYVNLILAAGLILVLFLIGIIYTVSAKQDTCPQDNGWTKIDSDDLSLYPVDGATKYCFKAGSDNSQGCTGGIFESIPSGGFIQPYCGLSHWSYFKDVTPTVTPTVTPSYTVTPTRKPCCCKKPTPTLTPTLTPTVTPTIVLEPSVTPKQESNPAPGAPPEWSEPCFYLRDSQECLPKSKVFPGEGQVFGAQK